MEVLKRNGKTQEVSFDKVKTRLQNLVNKTPILLNVDVCKVTQKVIARIYNNISTIEIDEISANICTSMVTEHPDYTKLGSRIIISNNHKNTETNFGQKLNKLYEQGLITEEIINIYTINKTIIETTIDYERDYNFDFFGYKTLEKSYLQKIDSIVIERIQDMFMRVSLGIHKTDIEEVLKTYDLMSSKYFIHASPTLFNAGTHRPQLLSCFLLGIKDSIQGIYKCLGDCADISKWAGGIGLHISNIRASNSLINGTNGYTSGLVPMLKVFNATARYVNQGGKRLGSFAIYLEPHHADILDFIELKKNHGFEDDRARDLFYGLWVSDLFMERVRDNKDWSLFSVDDCPDLDNTWGEDYKLLYEKYESEGKSRKTIPAQQLWFKICVSQIETGTPYLLFKDSCNRKSNQQHYGTIKSSNLCTEIIEYSDDKEYACCTLSSIGLPSYIEEGKFNFQKLYEVTKVVTKNLNKVIDLNYYPVPETELSNKKHRPLGIGVQGLADVFVNLRMPFDSEEAALLNKQIFAVIYYSAMEESIKLAKKYGPYSSFAKSPLSEGKFQFDLWNVEPIHSVDGLELDWNTLREDVINHGAYNSLLLAPMPTASTSQILGFNECFEPYTSFLYSRSTLAGEFEVVNNNLIYDLIELGLWDENMKNKLLQNEGSIQKIEEIPQHIKEIYKNSWDLSNKTLINMSADRGAYVCQSQSLNLFIAEPNFKNLSSMHFYSWKKGLKTGIYYLRTLPKTSAQKFTVEPVKSVNKSNANNEPCESCTG
tara:strand:- start:6201 stop:8504 length:2304 start_codon:yes stop_codon:yes gene_type:complete